MTAFLFKISTLLAGFSIISALILLFAYLFFLENMRKNMVSKVACTITLVCLACLQYLHFLAFVDDAQLLSSRTYASLLAIIPPSVFYLGREVLFPDLRYSWFDGLHSLVPIASFALAVDQVPLYAFLFGAAYTLWFARVLYRLKDQRQRYQFEFFFFGLFALMAIAALLLGLSLPYLEPHTFYLFYSNAIAMAMLLVVAALLIFPELLSDIMVITETAYAKSKLQGVNTAQKLDDLNRLMMIEKHYENEELNLSTVADLLGLSNHQLSELINTQHQCSFPQFVRQFRIDAAKKLLLEHPDYSVLSISMMTGFRSQSSFYAAFKANTGESPANYRKTRNSID